jgi:YidC/Oxa1 family membrane protein insertase
LEKRTILALLLIIVIFYISNEYVWKPKQQTLQQKELSSHAEQLESFASTENLQTRNESLQTFLPFETNTATLIENDISLENEFIKITFSNAGAAIIGVELKQFFSMDQESHVNLIRGNIGLQTTLLEPNGNRVDLKDVVFSYSHYSGWVEFSIQNEQLSLRKTYKLVDSYQLDYTYEVQYNTSFAGYRIGFENGIADTEKFVKDKRNDYRIYAQIENQLSNKALAKLKEPVMISGKIDWIAIRSKYFLMAIIPGDLIFPEKAHLFSTSGQESPAFWLEVNTPHTTFTHQYRLFMGPLSEKELNKFGIGLDNTIQMGPGILRWMSKLFQAFFIMLYKLIPQWGLCIIIFSFVMKLLLYPLTHKSFEAGMKMQEVQPKLKVVQEKYKHDPRLMNKEVQKLYKEHGVSPLGGCLPLLLQFPIFIALMPIIRNAIELRQAEFLWMNDLSEPDPYVILPIIMAVFMFIQHIMMQPKKQNIEDMDDKQKAAMQSQKMMGYIMPVVMFFLFKSFPAGLVIYWTTFNIFSLVQQYFIRKKFGVPQTIPINSKK